MSPYRYYCPLVALSFHQYTLVGMLLFSISITSGCGNRLPASVTGSVTLDGVLVKSTDTIAGTITFYPTLSGAAPYADLKSDGTYELRTGGTSGITPGEYEVTVRIVAIEPEPPGGYVNAPNAQLLHHTRFEDPKLSGLRFQVVEGANRIDLAVTKK